MKSVHGGTAGDGTARRESAPGGQDWPGASPFTRRGSVRALVPLSVVGVVAAAAVIAPRIASAAPDLPPISAQDLLVKALDSKVDAFSGTASLTTNLGLPALPGDVGSASPLSLISGTHTLQVAADGPTRQRIALLGQMAEYDLVHNGDQVWIYDSSTNSVGHGVRQAGQKTASPDRAAASPDEPPLTPQQAAQQFLAAVGPSTKITVDGTRSVAGIAAYTLIITPKQSGSLIGKVKIAIDAQNGAPLEVAAYAAGSTTPAFDLGFTSVSFTAPPASRFDFTPPKGAKVTPLSGETGTEPDQQKPASEQQPQVLGKDWLSVVELYGVDLGQLQSSAAQASNQGDGNGQSGQSGLLNGDASSYLSTVLGSGRKVSGTFGSGTLFTTDFLSVLITDDGRMFVGAVTSSVLEADASAQGMK